MRSPSERGNKKGANWIRPTRCNNPQRRQILLKCQPLRIGQTPPLIEVQFQTLDEYKHRGIFKKKLLTSRTPECPGVDPKRNFSINLKNVERQTNAFRTSTPPASVKYHLFRCDQFYGKILVVSRSILITFSVETNMWICGIAFVELHQIGVKATHFSFIMNTLHIVVNNDCGTLTCCARHRWY